MPSFNVNTDALVKFTNKLERLNEKAMPNAVRNTLNSLAFDVKKRTLPISAHANFVNRQAMFFKTFSRVEMAKGNELRFMEAQVGMRDIGGKNYAVKELEQQEFGGTIDHKAFIPMDTARTGKNNKKLVQKKHRLGSIRTIVKSNQSRGANPAQRFIKASVHAGVGGHVLNERGILYRVDSLVSGRKKMTPIYSVRSGRSISVKATHFMQEAVEFTTPRTNRFFKYNAKREFDRVLK